MDTDGKKGHLKGRDVVVPKSYSISVYPWFLPTYVTPVGANDSNPHERISTMVVGDGFEPSKASPTDFPSKTDPPPAEQSAPVVFQKSYGGGGWIRTIEGIANRFTVCPGCPLRYPTKVGRKNEWEYNSRPRPALQALFFLNNFQNTLDTDILRHYSPPVNA
jgi:hypothetical protein